jgi:hypothetical protein
LVYGSDGDLVAELAEGSRQHLSTFFLFSGTDLDALLDKSHSLMQDLPNETTEPMSNRLDGGLIAEAGQQTPEHGLKMTVFLGHRSVRCLVQHSSHVFITFRRSTTVALLRAFVLARTGSHPRRQLRGRWERTGLGPYFSNDLLRRIHSQTGHLRQSNYGVLLWLHGCRDHAIKPSHLLIDQLQPLQLQG